MELLGVLATAWISLLFVVLSWTVKGRIDRFEASVERGFAAVNSDIAALHSELRSEIAALRSAVGSEIASLRSDLTQIALAVGARPRRNTS
jgi:hypothetical protein